MGIAAELFNDRLDPSPISYWEVFLFVLIVTVFSLVRRNESNLINTFTFTFYWGFKSLVQEISTLGIVIEHAILLYVISGLSLFALVQLSYIRENGAKVNFWERIFPRYSKEKNSLSYQE